VGFYAGGLFFGKNTKNEETPGEAYSFPVYLNGIGHVFPPRDSGRRGFVSMVAEDP
jgi:hypothetical protein